MMWSLTSGPLTAFSAPLWLLSKVVEELDRADWLQCRSRKKGFMETSSWETLNHGLRNDGELLTETWPPYLNTIPLEFYFSKTIWDFPGGPVANTPHSHAEGQGLIPSQGSRPHVLQLRVCMLQPKILCATTKS